MADKNIPIIPLKESDIISQSVNTINQNFNTIRDNYDIANFKWEQYSKKITDEIEKLKRYCDKSNIDIARSVDSLNTRIDNITDLNDIQTQINNAIMNANLELTGFISDLAGQQVANAMGGYVKTSSLDNKLKGYVASSAFETYKSDAKSRTASSNLIVANSKFATIKSDNEEYLMYSNGTKSSYKTIEEYWNAIKNNIDPTGKGLDDEKIFNNFIQKCEDTFRTVATELANISVNVGQGSAQVGIIATVKSELGNESSDDAKDITAAIFARANQYGSEIALNADNINISANHKLKLSSDTFELKSNNLTIDENGLVLTGNNRKTMIGIDGILRAQGAVIQGDITANKFISNTSQTTETIGSDVWTFERSSVMDDHEFRVSSLRKKGNTDMSPSHIYITILPEYTMENSQENPDLWTASDNGKLMGVPVLCFEYDGKPYYLTPGVWKSSGGSTAKSNIYWKKLGDIYAEFDYMGNLSSKANYRLAFTNYHIFKPSVNNELVSYVSKPFYRVYYDTSKLSGDELTNANAWLDNNGLRNSAGVYSISDKAANYGTSIGSTRDITESMCNIFSEMKFTGKIFKTPITTINKKSSYTPIHTIETDLNLNGSIINYICSEDVFGWDNNWTPTIDCVDSNNQTNHGGDFIQFLQDVYIELNNGTRKCKAAKKVEYTYSENYNNGVKTGSDVTGIYVKTTYGIVVDLSDKDAINYGGNREQFDVTTAKILVSFNSYFDYSSSPINESSVVQTITNSLKSSSLSEQDIQNHIRFEGVIWGIPKNQSTPNDEPIATYGNVNLDTWKYETIFQEIDS